MKTQFILLLSIITLQTSAQSFSFMPKVGHNAACISGLPSETRTKHGISIGLSAEYRLSQPIAIESGIYYSMQGATITYEYGRELLVLDLDIDNDYINIPFFIKGYIYKGLYIYGGPQIGFLINSKLNISEKISFLDLIEWKNDDSYHIADYQNHIDFSGVIGIGYLFDIGLLISANYNAGINTLFNVDKMEVKNLSLADLSSTHNKVFQLHIGWKF